MSEEKSPVTISREDYITYHLRQDMENDYALLYAHYNLIRKLFDAEDNGQMSLYDSCDKILKASQQINIIHDRIRGRLYL